MPKERIAYIDFMKGLCIILILISHVNNQLFDLILPNLNHALMSFRIPMYFFLSGLFFKTYSGFNEFIRKKVNNLIITLLFFHFLCCFIRYPLVVISNHFNLDFQLDFGLIDFIPPFFGRSWKAAGALWFLVALFGVNMLYYWFQKYFNLIGVLLAVAVCAIAGNELMHYRVMLPFVFDIALVGLPYFMLGAVVKKLGFLKSSRYDKWGILVMILCMVLVYFTSGQIDFLAQDIPDMFRLYVVPFIAILALFWCCKNLGYIPFICYYGRYSIVVLGTHQVIIDYVITALHVMGVYGRSVTVLTLVIVLFLEFFVIKIMIKYFPKLTAQQDFFKPGWKVAK